MDCPRPLPVPMSPAALPSPSVHPGGRAFLCLPRAHWPAACGRPLRSTWGGLAKPSCAIPDLSPGDRELTSTKDSFAPS